MDNLPLYRHLNLSELPADRIQDYLIDYKKYVAPFVVGLINKLLTLDPKQRINVDNAVKSDVFEPEPLSEDLKTLLSNHSSMFESNKISHKQQRQM